MNLTVALAFALLPMCCLAQRKHGATIENLKTAKGFDRLVTGSSINTIPGCRLTYLDGKTTSDADSCIFFEYQDYSAMKINADLTLRAIALRVYKEKIVSVYLFFDKADGFKVLRDFLTRYGQFTNRPNAYADVFEWTSDAITLELQYQLDVDLGMAVYTDTSLQRQIAADKQKRLLRQLMIAAGWQ